jgi:hypothetical protein
MQDSITIEQAQENLRSAKRTLSKMKYEKNKPRQASGRHRPYKKRSLDQVGFFAKLCAQLPNNGGGLTEEQRQVVVQLAERMTNVTFRPNPRAP